jgi:hypothetical protein
MRQPAQNMLLMSIQISSKLLKCRGWGFNKSLLRHGHPKSIACGADTDVNKEIKDLIDQNINTFVTDYKKDNPTAELPSATASATP